MVAEDPSLAAKLASLALLDQALRDGAVAEAPIDLAHAQKILLAGPDAPGDDLRRTLATRVRASAARRCGARWRSGYWVEVRARDLRPLILSTRGSRADLRLAAYADCRETGKPALAEADDNFGLQADLGLVPAHADQFWRVRVDSTGDGDGVLSLLGGEFIRGRVTREAGGQGIGGISVAAFSAGGSYVSSSSTATDGSYQLPVYQGPAPISPAPARTTTTARSGCMKPTAARTAA